MELRWIELSGRALVEGRARGTALVLDEPLSFWGGVSPDSGEIIDRHHPQSGASTTGRVLVLPHGRGSSSASYVLAECIRAGSGPTAVLLRNPDSIIALGALVAAELYPDRSCPVVVLGGAYDQVRDGCEIEVDGPRVRLGS